MDILRRDDFTLALRFKDAPLHVLNAIRRAIIEEVPTIAVDVVYFMENNSALHDEALAHRLGMIPFVSSEAIKKYKRPEECMDRPEEEGCSTRGYLEVRNDGEEEIIALSGDLKIEDPDVRPVYLDIPIIVLSKGQRVILETVLRLGRGKEHIKWSPVTISTMTYQPVLSFNLRGLSEDKAVECRRCLSYYDERLAEVVFSRGEGEVRLDPLRPTGLLRYCSSQACRNCVEVRYLENELVLRFESTGALAPEEIFRLAVKELREKLDVFLGELRPLIQGPARGV